MRLFRTTTTAFEPLAEDVRAIASIAATLLGAQQRQTEQVALKNAHALLLAARDLLIEQHAEQLETRRRASK
jgi:hypothetical protein